MSVLRSPIFILCAVIFIIHQLMQKVMDIHFTLFDSYLDNLLAMPIILTLLMIERRYLLGRKQLFSLSVLEIFIATFFIVVVAEIVFPLLSSDFTADWWDLLFYALGSFIFYLTINPKGKNHA